MFYDGHNCFTSLLAGDTVASAKLLDNVRDYIQDNRKVGSGYEALEVDVQLFSCSTVSFVLFDCWCRVGTRKW